MIKFIKSIDEENPALGELAYIKSTKCLNCHKDYEDFVEIYFVKLSRVIWWHKNSCTYVPKEYPECDMCNDTGLVDNYEWNQEAKHRIAGLQKPCTHLLDN